MNKKLLFCILVFTVVCIGVLHFVTPAELIFYHNSYRRLSYFPIVLGAIWFGVGGGLSLAVLSSVAFIPHLLLFAGHGLQSYFSELSEIVLYLAAGLFVGLISGREHRLRQRVEVTSAKLEKSYDELYRGTLQLIEAEEQLAAVQRVSALGEMAASVAHEIKNPLSSIKGTAEILLEDFPKNHPKREFVEILLREVARLNVTLESVLGYAGGKNSNHDADELLSDVLLHQIKLMDPVLIKNGIELKFENLEISTDFKVVGNPLRQVFLNLIINSIEALKSVKKPRIVVDILKTSTGCCVEVHDNGPGVSAEDKEKLFTPFFSTKEDGTGLGLLISRKLIEGCGGSLLIKESRLEGACFSVFIPAEKGIGPLKKIIDGEIK